MPVIKFLIKINSYLPRFLCQSVHTETSALQGGPHTARVVRILGGLSAVFYTSQYENFLINSYHILFSLIIIKLLIKNNTYWPGFSIHRTAYECSSP